MSLATSSRLSVYTCLQRAVCEDVSKSMGKEVRKKSIRFPWKRCVVFLEEL